MDENLLFLSVEHFIQLFGGLEELLWINILLTVIQGQVDHICDPVLRVDCFHAWKQDLPLFHILFTLQIEHALNTLFDNEVYLVRIRRIRTGIDAVIAIDLIYKELIDQIAIHLVNESIY